MWACKVSETETPPTCWAILTFLDTSNFTCWGLSINKELIYVRLRLRDFWVIPDVGYAFGIKMYQVMNYAIATWVIM